MLVSGHLPGDGGGGAGAGEGIVGRARRRAADLDPARSVRRARERGRRPAADGRACRRRRRDCSRSGRRLACVTLGARGAVAVLEGRVERARPETNTPEDAFGAGDAFAAGLLVALARGDALGDALAAGLPLRRDSRRRAACPRPTLLDKPMGVTRERTSWVGQPVARFEDEALLRGEGRFIDDLDPVPHARPCGDPALAVRARAHRRARPARALELPGVIGVLTGADVAALSRPFPVGVAERTALPAPRPTRSRATPASRSPSSSRATATSPRTRSS